MNVGPDGQETTNYQTTTAKKQTKNTHKQNKQQRKQKKQKKPITTKTTQKQRNIRRKDKRKKRKMTDRYCIFTQASIHIFMTTHIDAPIENPYKCAQLVVKIK